MSSASSSSSPAARRGSIPSRPTIYFISGHRDITDAEFKEHYIPRLDVAMKTDAQFVMGVCRGVDVKAFDYLWTRLSRETRRFRVTVYLFENNKEVEAMLLKDYINVGVQFIKCGFKSHDERDEAMTNWSDEDILWVRKGKENSGTAKNLSRRRRKAEIEDCFRVIQ
jgi:hypothetical protein